MTLLARRDPRIDEEALIKEARRLRRRRWLIGSALTALAAAAAAAGFIAASGPPARPPARADGPAPRSGAETPGYTAPSTHPFIPTRALDLLQPTTLATLPDGDLLILDSSRDQILKLPPRGALSVFAGDGRIGFSGDGGPARDAELDLTYFTSASIAVTPNGSVDFLDDGSCRIRQVSPRGIIHTILRLPLSRSHPSGTFCPIDAFALSPAGEIYIATNSKIERLTRGGRVAWVAGSSGPMYRAPANPTPSTVVFSPDALAFNPAGDLYIASFEPKIAYRLTPGGKLTPLDAAYPIALAATPAGAVVAGSHFGVIQEARATAVRTFYNVTPEQVKGIHWGRDGGFQEDGIAVARDGTVYVGNAQGNGYGAGTVLVSISPDKRAALVPIRTPLSATLPKLGAPGFPASVYPASRPSHSPALASCPSEVGIEPFTTAAIGAAKRIARNYSSSQFASSITVTDRSWWTVEFNAFASGNLGGPHTVTGARPAVQTAAAAGIERACGTKLIQDSLAVTLGASPYSTLTGTLYLLDRAGHPLVYYVR